MKQWSRNFKECVRCSTTSIKHKGRGLCKSCYFKEFLTESGLGKRYVAQRKLRINKRCNSCGTLIDPRNTLCRSCAKKGKIFSEEHKLNIKKVKQNIPLKTRKRISLAKIEYHKNNPVTEAWKENQSEKMKKLAKEGKHSGMFKKGMIPWSKGKQRPDIQGEKNPSWKGGISNEPYDLRFNKAFKKYVRGRDHYACLLCNLFEEDNLKLYKRRLAIHHIDYDKKNSIPQNGCALCTRCNGLVNKNRDEWKVFFQRLLSRLYGYEYTEDQKIILDFQKSRL